MFYQELTTYSPVIDGPITRLSMTNERGHEYFALIPRKAPKLWRKHKETALDQIAEAIETAAEPGEVAIILDLK